MPTKVAQKRASIFGSSGQDDRRGHRDLQPPAGDHDAVRRAAGAELRDDRQAAEEPAHEGHADDIKRSIEGGSTLPKPSASIPVQFDELYRQPGARLASRRRARHVLDTIASYKENIESLKGKIKKALFYPAAVIAVAILVSAILLIYVVPQFEAVFKSFGADLPAFTQMIVGASEFMVSYWWLMLAIVVGIIFGLHQASEALAQFRIFSIA
jgi:type II secretory pathway component PulF